MTLSNFVRAALLALLAAGTSAAAEFRVNFLLLDGAVVGPDIVAVGERGAIVRSTDDGRSWTPAASPTAATLTGVAFAPGSDHGWAVGHDALILATDDRGRTWRRQWQGENLQDSFLDVIALDARRVIAVGAYGLFVTTDDGGRTWTRRKISDDDYHFNRITRGPDSTLYLAGERGTLLRSRDSGAHWERIDAPYDGSFYGILPLGKAELVAYGLRGRLFHSTDDGAVWQPVADDLRVLFMTAARTKSGAILFAGQSRAWLVSRDHGATVEPWSSPLASAVAELVPLENGTVLALGEAGATLLPAP